MGLILLIVLIVLLLGAAPTWPYSRRWGYGPSGLVGLLLIILLVLVLGAVPAYPHSANWGYGPSGLLGALLVVLLILLLMLVVFTKGGIYRHADRSVSEEKFVVLPCRWKALDSRVLHLCSCGRCSCSCSSSC